MSIPAFNLSACFSFLLVWILLATIPLNAGFDFSGGWWLPVCEPVDHWRRPPLYHALGLAPSEYEQVGKLWVVGDSGVSFYTPSLTVVGDIHNIYGLRESPTTIIAPRWRLWWFPDMFQWLLWRRKSCLMIFCDFSSSPRPPHPTHLSGIDISLPPRYSSACLSDWEGLLIYDVWETKNIGGESVVYFSLLEVGSIFQTLKSIMANEACCIFYLSYKYIERIGLSWTYYYND